MWKILEQIYKNRIKMVTKLNKMANKIIEIIE